MIKTVSFQCRFNDCGGLCAGCKDWSDGGMERKPQLHCARRVDPPKW